MAHEINMALAINKIIAKAIVSAQLCSDGGKQDYHIECRCDRGPYHMGYALKDKFILRAIKIITSTKNDFSFYVESKGDQNGYPSVVTYFEYKYGSVKHQISFHTPMRKAYGLMPYVGKGRKTHWNCARTSRTDSELLVELFHL